MNYTKGPWKLGELKGKYYGTRVYVSTDEYIEVWCPDHFANPFASVREIENGWTPDYGHDHTEDARSYSIACLIAAAPDLLEACKECLAHFQREIEDDPTMLHSDFGQAYQLTVAAIKKVTGGAK